MAAASQLKSGHLFLACSDSQFSVSFAARRRTAAAAAAATAQAHRQSGDTVEVSPAMYVFICEMYQRMRGHFQRDTLPLCCALLRREGEKAMERKRVILGDGKGCLEESCHRVFVRHRRSQTRGMEKKESEKGERKGGRENGGEFTRGL